MPRKRRRGKGEGTITQRPDGRWMGQITVGYDPVTGKQVRKTVYGETQKEVQEKLLDLRNEARDGSLGQSDMPLGVFLEFWLSSKKPRLASPSYIKYRWAVGGITSFLGSVPLDRLSAFDVARFFENLESTGTSAGHRKYLATILRMSLEDGVRLGLLKTNPATKIARPRARAKEIIPLSQGQVTAFLTAARPERLYALYVLALDSGARWSELFALDWDDIDLRAGTVTITKALKVVRNQGLVVEGVKSARSRRRLRISAATVKALDEHRERMLHEGHASSIVFCTADGKHYHSVVFFRLWDKFRRRAGFRTLRFHDLRHTMATYLLSRGVNVKVVSERLGHSSVTMTLETYAHVMPGMEDQVVNLTGELVAVNQQQAEPERRSLDPGLYAQRPPA